MLLETCDSGGLHEAPGGASQTRTGIEQHLGSTIVGIIEAVRAIERDWCRRDRGRATQSVAQHRHCWIPRLPRISEAHVGDLLVFSDAGAYGASMSSNYNSRPLAPEVPVDGSEVRLIRRRQRMEELLALEAT